MEAEISDPMSIRILQQVFSALRKISNDVIIVVGPNFFSIRALNSTKSALPVITFNSSFFKSFRFESLKGDRADGQQIVAQIQANAVTTAFKNAQSPSLIILNLKVSRNNFDNNFHRDNQLSENSDSEEKESYKKIPSIYDKTFEMSLVDKYSITHTWEFPLSDAQVLNAMFDLNDAVAEVKCRYDILEGLADYFKNINTIFLELNNNNNIINDNNSNSNASKKGVILFKSSPVLISVDDSNTNSNHSDGSLSSTLSIFRGERCEVTNFQSDKNQNVVQVAFSLFEFLVGLKIARNLNQYVNLHIIGPGQPLILDASMASVDFKMPLATINDENENENEEENDFQNETDNEVEDDYSSKNKSREMSKVKQEKNIDNNNRYNSLNNDTYSNTNSDESQVIPWNFMNNNNNDDNDDFKSKVKTEKQTPKASFDSQDSSSFPYDKRNLSSQTYAQALYEASPPFPSKRKFAGSNEVAQASQPMSDEEDEDY